MAEIVHYRRKPQTDENPQVAARYLPPEDGLGTFRKIAQMADSGAQVIQVEWGSDTELVVRYTNREADRPHIVYVHVPAGQWLAYDPQYDLLYETAGHNWERWYDVVAEDDNGDD